MNTSMYSQAAFESAQATQIAEREKALEADPDVRSARGKLEKAQADLESLQGYVKGLKLEKRMQFNGNVAQAKEVLAAAEKEVRTAINAHTRRDYLKKLESQEAERTKQREAQHAQFALEQETAAKREFQSAWLQSGGTSESFEHAWKTTIWPKELEARTAQQVGATQRALKQSHAYAL